MAKTNTAGELQYHEQQEGWTYEHLPGGSCVCIMRPRELGGRFVTIDLDRRVYTCGYGKPRQHAGNDTYTGKDGEIASCMTRSITSMPS
ncbi:MULTISPECIES: hypothetical protein [unclassified Massilia]|uniref:hypothetical protein n=1 Tax=unclassified Massilia TaxID=2609279 RepID=UPI0017810314|nr:MULTISPECIES: hypothetical protein [unclassified Massilia]MBD8531691.1 hypothetical protein [Massilia sp. CFBP 13647]MBD8675136.1 hypothetical protein [Massilia sp. CFBP 13721]